MIAASAKLLLQTLTSPGQGETAIFGIWCLESAHAGLTANTASVYHIRQINAVEPQILCIETLQQLHTVAVCQGFVAIGTTHSAHLVVTMTHNQQEAIIDGFTAKETPIIGIEDH